VADYIKKQLKIQLHHETIYQFIYEDKAKGVELYKHLRIANKPYRKRYGSYDRRGCVLGAKVTGHCSCKVAAIFKS